MNNPETKNYPRTELPKAQEARWHEFLDPHKAKENFQKILRAIREVV